MSSLYAHIENIFNEWAEYEYAHKHISNKWSDHDDVHNHILNIRTTHENAHNHPCIWSPHEESCI